jgi:hypothetical protein
LIQRRNLNIESFDLGEINLGEVSNAFWQAYGLICNCVGQAFDVDGSLRRNDAVLGKMAARHANGVLSARYVDRLSALTNEHLSCPKQHGTCLLSYRLQCNEPHRWPRGRFNDGFSVGNIILLSFYKRLHIIWCNQSHCVPQLLDLAAPAMGRSTGHHRNKARGVLAHKCKTLNTVSFLRKITIPFAQAP